MNNILSLIKFTFDDSIILEIIGAGLEFLLIGIILLIHGKKHKNKVDFYEGNDNLKIGFVAIFVGIIILLICEIFKGVL